MESKTEFDLWADEHEPKVRPAWTSYRLTLPDKVRSTMKTSEIPFVYVEVDEYGLLSLDEHHTYWFGDKLTHVDGSKSSLQIRREIYEWLVEWELAIWVKIGPEDSELFATKKLTGDDYEYERYR